MKIVADDRIPFLRGVLEPFAEVVYKCGSEIAPEDVRDADALLVRTRTACNARLLAGSSVRYIATATIGFDHIDASFCRDAGIEWSSAPGCNSSSVKQYVASVLSHLSLRENIVLEGKTLGIVGVGHVGSKVAAVGNAFGMNVLLCDPPRSRKEGPGQFCTPDTIFEKSDIVTLHVPLNEDGEDKTFHMLDSERLSSMRRNQVLINSSRGEVVDSAALKASLERGAPGFCALDVWEGEPAIDRRLMALADISTPHIAGYSADGKAAGTTAAVRSLARFFNLPLTGWSAFAPSPAESVITVDAEGKSDEQVLCEAVLGTYDVSGDSALLRRDPGGFERQRGEYPLRREPSAFTLRLKGGSQELASRLELLDFNVIRCDG